LHGVAFVRTQKRQLFFGLHAFRHHLEIETVRHGGDCHGDRRVIGVGGDVAHE
jgi:hypothetical protein